MTGDWTAFWHRMANLRWSATDQHVLEVVGDLLGWGPGRTLLELGAGRGWHSRVLNMTGRCGDLTLCDTAPEAQTVGHRSVPNAYIQSHPTGQHDVVWSFGLVEHFDPADAKARQDIIDRHFAHSGDWVVIVVPAATWTRRMFRPRGEVPDQWGYTVEELQMRMLGGAYRHWGWPYSIEMATFAPLFGIRHIPDAFYWPLTRLFGWLLPKNLLVGVARRYA